MSRYVGHRMDNMPFEPNYAVSPFCRMQRCDPETGEPGPFCGAAAAYHVAYAHPIGERGIMVVRENHGLCKTHMEVVAHPGVIEKTAVLVHTVGEHCGHHDSVVWMDAPDGGREAVSGCQPWDAEPEAVALSDNYLLRGFAAWTEREHAAGRLVSDRPAYIGGPPVGG